VPDLHISQDMTCEFGSGHHECPEIRAKCARNGRHGV